jgi:hypothetical protein
MWGTTCRSNKERIEMNLEEFVAGERWMTPEEQAEHDYDQCLRPD